MAYIGSVQEWKEEQTWMFAEMHKDVYGSKYAPDFSDDSMEDVIGSMDRMYAMVLESIREDEMRACRWEARKMHNRLMCAEASVTPGGAVFTNPDWNDMCESSWGYSDYAQIHKHCYYMPEKPFTNDQLQAMGAI